MWSFIKNIFQSRREKPKGILLYGTVQEVIKIHKELESAGFSVRLVAPPPEVRVGCDLAIEFDLMEQEAIETVLTVGQHKPSRIVSTKEMLPDILKRTVFVEIDGYLMCKAGNMKITVDQKDRKIVNISGGGCPDIPYVAHALHGVAIDEAKDPIELGHSLCSFMLQIAFDALKKKVKQQ